MDWFSGGVPAAIAASRRDNTLFVVYVYDDSAASTATSESWNHDLVLGALSGNQAVAIKVAKGSLEYQQFCQIYPVFIFPSVFCIGLTGKALAIMNGQQKASELQEKLKEAFQKLKEQLEPAPPTASPQATPTESETPPTESETPPTHTEDSGARPPPSSQPSPPEKTDPVTSAGDGGGAGGGAGAEGGAGGGAEGGVGVDPQESNEEKMERAQQMILQKRREKEEEEFQKQKREELKRREEGREFGESKKSLEDLQRQNWIHERKKAKQEEKAAREAILAKLRQDRLEKEAEKRARDQQPSPKDGVVRKRPAPPSSSSPSSSLSSAGVCRVQLRLPSGDKSVVEMSAEDNLEALREKVSTKLGVREGDLILSSAYPRREFTADMNEDTLAQLGLIPSGVVVVRFKTRGYGGGEGGKGDGGWLWALLAGLLEFLLSLVAMVKRVCGCGDEGELDGDQQRDTRPQSGRGANSGGGGERRGGGKGKVHRLLPADFDEESSDDDDDEERRNTYNGNSTEQQ